MADTAPSQPVTSFGSARIDQNVSARKLEPDGFEFVPGLLDEASSSQLAHTFRDFAVGGGTRHLIDHPAITTVLESSSVRKLMTRVLSDNAFAFKATLFDKHDGANWLVAWHRDMSLPVSHHINLTGWSAWTVKDGVHYVQPPHELLSRIVALRINLDACEPDDGPLRVLPGTHRLKNLSNAQSTLSGQSIDPVECVGRTGDAWLMCPLLLHASSKATRSTRRRVLHLEFADFDLPADVRWHRQIAMRPHDANAR